MSIQSNLSTHDKIVYNISALKSKPRFSFGHNELRLSLTTKNDLMVVIQTIILNSI